MSECPICQKIGSHIPGCPVLTDLEAPLDGPEEGKETEE